MMDLVLQLIDFIVHIDVHLGEIITNYGTWTYGCLLYTSDAADE